MGAGARAGVGARAGAGCTPLEDLRNTPARPAAMGQEERGGGGGGGNEGRCTGGLPGKDGEGKRGGTIDGGSSAPVAVTEACMLRSRLRMCTATMCSVTCERSRGGHSRAAFNDATWAGHTGMQRG